MPRANRVAPGKYLDKIVSLSGRKYKVVSTFPDGWLRLRHYLYPAFYVYWDDPAQYSENGFLSHVNKVVLLGDKDGAL